MQQYLITVIQHIPNANKKYVVLHQYCDMVIGLSALSEAQEVAFVVHEYLCKPLL